MLRPTWYSKSLTFKCYSVAVILAGSWVVAGIVQWNRIWPSFCPATCLGVFLDMDHLFSQNFVMVLETLIKLCVTELNFSWKNFFCPKIWGNGPQTGFFNLNKNLDDNFHWICSIMKICIICCVAAQILYLGKILFQNYRLTCSQPIRLQDF